MTASFLTSAFELAFISSAKIDVRSVDLLYAKYDKCVGLAQAQFRASFADGITVAARGGDLLDLSLCVQQMQVRHASTNDRGLPIDIQTSSTQFLRQERFPIRENSTAWAYHLYPSYLRHLNQTGLFSARVTLNLRQIALSIHGGLYVDVDVMTDGLAGLYKLQLFFETYYKAKRFVQTFRLARVTLTPPQSKMLFMSRMKKMRMLLCLPPLMHINLNHIDERVYLLQIDEYLQQIDQYYQLQLNLMKSLLVRPLIHSSSTIRYSRGIYAMSQRMPFNADHCSTARFTQCILFCAGQAAQNIIQDAVVLSLYFNMLLSMVQPGQYIVLKTSHVNYLCPLVFSYSCPIPRQFEKMGGVDGRMADAVFTVVDDATVREKLNKILLPSDLFFTRDHFPYLIIDVTGAMKVTKRMGRLLHPLSQISNRGAWNFILAHIHDFHEVEGDLGGRKKYSARFFNISLYPECSIVQNSDQVLQQAIHWTKGRPTVHVI